MDVAVYGADGVADAFARWTPATTTNRRTLRVGVDDYSISVQNTNAGRFSCVTYLQLSPIFSLMATMSISSFRSCPTLSVFRQHANCQSITCPVNRKLEASTPRMNMRSFWPSKSTSLIQPSRYSHRNLQNEDRCSSACIRNCTGRCIHVYIFKSLREGAAQCFAFATTR